MNTDEALVQLDQIGRISNPELGIEVFYDHAQRPELYVLAIAAIEMAWHTPKPDERKVRRMLRAGAILLRDEAIAQGMPATMEECMALLQRREPEGMLSHPEGTSEALALVDVRLLAKARRLCE